MRSRRLLTGLALAALVLTACQTPAPADPQSTSSTDSRPAHSARVTKLLVFVVENHSRDEMRSQMPAAFALAREYGFATRYRAITHPSLPNYLAIAGGSTFGVTDDASPASHEIHGPSVFGQAIDAGKTAEVYAEGMPRRCALATGGDRYAVKHNPWAYYTTERAECQKHDVPITQLASAITKGQLPNVGMVVPNLCNDAHNCPLSTADAWFKGWMSKIVAGPDWKSGHLAIVLTGDEDDKTASNTVLTVVIHPSQKAHVVATPLTHYSLTGLYEDVAGVPYLFKAASAPSMARAFGLPVQGSSG